MPLNGNALTTLAAAKSYLKIDVSDTSQDSLLESLINASSNVIENYCGQKFKEQTHTDEYDGTDTRNLFLDQINVSTVTSVEIDEVLVDSLEYKLRKSGILVRLNGVWPKGILNIAVSYTAGFSAIPDDLELACKHLVLSYYKADLASFSTTFQDGFIFRPEAIPSQVKALISPYKKVM